jgi:hypothetical protein
MNKNGLHVEGTQIVQGSTYSWQRINASHRSMRNILSRFANQSPFPSFAVLN